MQSETLAKVPHSPILRPGVNCWVCEPATRVALLVDAAAYFDAVREALRRARRSVLILGWDIHSQADLAAGDSSGEPVRLAALLDGIARRRRPLRIHALSWDFNVIYTAERELLPIVRLGWGTHRRVQFHLDGHHPPGSSHHQKVIVVDDAIAFVGGLDLTTNRWDTPEHRADDPRRVDHHGRPYPPFHDVQILVEGPVARRLGDLARERWRRATGERLRPCQEASDPWPPAVAPDLQDVPVAIARTEPGWADAGEIREVERLYLDAIAAARHSVFLENQFLTSDALCRALAASLQRPQGPEVVVVGPRLGSGWLEETTLGVLRARVLRDLRAADRHGRFRAFHPVLPGLAEDQCLNVHDKVMVIDDRLLRVGSANLTNRSMAVDTECDLAIESDAPAVQATIGRFRDRLLGEHLNVSPEQVAEATREAGGLIAGIESLRGGERSLMPLEPVPDPEVEARLSQTDLVDPERPITADKLMARLLPGHPRPRTRGALARLLLLVALVAGLVLAWRWGPLADWIRPETLADRLAALRSSPAAGLLTVPAFVVLGLLAAPLMPMMFGTVLAFGPVAGGAYAVAGALASAIATWLVGRLLGRDRVHRLTGHRLERVGHRIARGGIVTMFVVRLVPVAPYFLVNLAAGALRFPLAPYVAGTALGLLPGTLGLALLGDRILEAAQRPSPGALAALFAVAGAIVLAAVALFRRLRGPRAGRDG